MGLLKDPKLLCFCGRRQDVFGELLRNHHNPFSPAAGI
jgi:hypothetical protein